MKLGIFRRPFTKLHEIVRIFSNWTDWLAWTILDFSKFKNIKTKNIKKILIVLVNGMEGNIGGNFCTLGVVNYFKKLHPEIELFLLSDNKSINQFGYNPGIKFIEYAGQNTIEELKKENIDAMIAMDFGPKLNVRDLFFIPYRIARSSSDFRGLFKLRNKLGFTRRVFIPWGMHMVDARFKLFEKLGFSIPKKGLKLFFSKKEEETVDKFLRKNKINKFIVLHPGGKHMVDTIKRKKCAPHLWSFEKYAKVADHFSEKGYNVLVTGAPNESLLFEKINEKANSQLINCCGQFNVKESAALLKKAKLLIATDTSIVHLAYQINVPIVELMGPSYPLIVGAWPLNDKKHKILFDNGRCAYSMRKIECPENKPCMENIKVKQVIRNMEGLLKNVKEKK